MLAPVSEGKQKSRAVARKPRDAAVNFDRCGVCKQCKLSVEVIQGILASIDRSYVTLYKQLVVTFALSSTISEIWWVSYVKSEFFHTQLSFGLKFGVFPLD